MVVLLFRWRSPGTFALSNWGIRFYSVPIWHLFLALLMLCLICRLAHYVIFVVDDTTEMTHYVYRDGTIIIRGAVVHFCCSLFIGDIDSYTGYPGVCGVTLSVRVREARALLAAVLVGDEKRRLVLLGCSGGATVADTLCTVRRHHLFSLCF